MAITFPVPESRRCDFVIGANLFVEYHARPKRNAHVYTVTDAAGRFCGIVRVTAEHFRRCQGYFTESWIDDFIALRCSQFSHLSVLDGGRDA